MEWRDVGAGATLQRALGQATRVAASSAYRPGGLGMENFVRWWCELVGIQDAYAMQVAAGILGGGSVLFLMLVGFGLAANFALGHLEQ